MLTDRWWAELTFELADFLYPGQGVDLHQRVGHADHVHHVHHTLFTHKIDKYMYKYCIPNISPAIDNELNLKHII